jgi:photosystem II stability/assembly factor-like uncharacterized protein
MVLLLTVSFLILFTPAEALAHAPHDEIRAILLSPTYFHDGTVFAIVRSNILRSVDFGHSWRRLTRGLGPYSFSDLAISPTFAIDRCLFAASDDGGIFRSCDAGISWAPINHGLTDLRLTFVSISPTFQNDHRLIALDRTGKLYATTDSGDHWNCVLHAPPEVAVAVAIKSALIVGSHAGRIYFLQDQSATWKELVQLPAVQPITCFLPLMPSAPLSRLLVGTANAGIILLQVDARPQVRALGLPGQHITSLACTHNEHGKPILFASTWKEALYRSEDEGASWTKHAKGLTTSRQADEPQFQRPHFRGIAVSSGYGFDQTVFLGGFSGIFKSTDEGRSWQKMHGTLSIGLIVGMALAPLSDTEVHLAVSTYLAGIYSHDTGGSWEVDNLGIEGHRLFDIAIAPMYPSEPIVFAISNWVLFKSTDGGRHWEATPLFRSSRNFSRITPHFYSPLRRLARITSGPGSELLLPLKQRLKAKLVGAGQASPGYGAMLAISPDFREDRTIFVGGSTGVLRSQDGGTTLHYVLPTTRNPVRNLVISPAFGQDATVFATFDDCVYRSTDRGTTWVACFKRPQLNVSRLAISPSYSQDQTVFLGSRAGLWRTRNGGTLWEPLAIGASVGAAPVDGLALSPFFSTDNEVFVHVSGVGLFWSPDRGNSFVPVTSSRSIPNLSPMIKFPDTAPLIFFSPHYNKDTTLYASSMGDLLKSTDRGTTWRVLRRPIRFENMRPEISYRGVWKTIRDRRFSSFNASCSATPGDAARMDFVGTEVRWIGMHGPHQGIANVMLDGLCIARVDQYADTSEFSVVSHVVSGLAYGPHSITVEVSAENYCRSSGNQIIIDAFDIT